MLSIPAYGAATVVFLFGFWLFFLTFCILLPWYDTAFLFFLGMGSIMLLVGAVWYLGVNFLYSRFLHLLWDKPPSWLLSPQSLKQNLAHLGVAIAATFPIAAVYIIHLLWVANLEVLTRIDYSSKKLLNGKSRLIAIKPTVLRSSYNFLKASWSVTTRRY